MNQEDKYGDEAFEIDTSNTQGLCPLCNGSFMYFPVKDEIVLLKEGQHAGSFAHIVCPGPRCPECSHTMSEHYDGVFCMVGDCTCKMHGGE